MTQARVVRCPQCGKPVEWRQENPFRPFCSERCKQIDLGAWAAGEYRLPASGPADLEEENPALNQAPGRSGQT